MLSLQYVFIALISPKSHDEAAVDLISSETRLKTGSAADLSAFSPAKRRLRGLSPPRRIDIDLGIYDSSQRCGSIDLEGEEYMHDCLFDIPAGVAL